MPDRKNVKIAEGIHEQLTEKRHSHETWNQFFLRLIDEETRPQGAYEEGILRFGDALDETGGVNVELLVEITCGPKGWSIETKRVTETQLYVNDREGRAQIADALSEGERFPLYVGNANGEFSVCPVLTWREDEMGDPIVANVEFPNPHRE